MGLIDRFRAFMAPTLVKASGVANLFARYSNGQPKWSPENYEAYSKEGYGKNAVVYRCINILGKSLATVPWCLQQGSGKNAKELDDPEHPLLKLLLRPNPLQGGHAFFESLVAYYLLHGNCYVEGVTAGSEDGTGAGAPKELYAHPPNRMKIIPHPLIANMPGQFVYEYNGGRKVWVVDPIEGKGPIMHWKTFNPMDDWYGQSVIRAAAYAVDQHNSAGAWNQALLQNNAAPAGGFRYAPANTVGATLTEPQRKQLQKDMEERLQGPANARRPLILDGGLEWIQIGMSPQDMDWLEGKKASALDICAVFGVPGQVYGIPDAQTFANYEQARLAMYEEAVIPLMDALCDELNHWLVPTFGEKLILKADWDEVDALAPKRAIVWERVQAADWLTLNEKREATSYEPLDEDMADQVFVDAGKVPLGMSADAGGAGANGAPALDANGNPVPGAGGAAAAPGDAPLPPVEGSGNAAPADGVQSAGLNGTQVTALQAILDDVATGQMAPEAAVIMILLSFPTFDPVQVQEMVDAQDAFEPTPPPAPVGPDGQPIVPGANPAGSGAPVAPGAKPTKKPGKQPATGKPSTPPKSDVDALVAELKAEGFKDDAAKALALLAYGEA